MVHLTDSDNLEGISLECLVGSSDSPSDQNRKKFGEYLCKRATGWTVTRASPGVQETGCGGLSLGGVLVLS